MMKNDSHHHNAREQKTDLPRHAVAKKPRGKLHKPRIDQESHRNENEPRDNHKPV
jgi:hypothetical protein